MKSMKYVLNQLKDFCETNLPALLTAQGLTNFRYYKIGECREPEEVGLYFYRDNKSLSVDRQVIDVIVQLQLPSINEETAATYDDVVSDYIFNLDAKKLGLDRIEGVTVDSYSQATDGICFSYVMASWVHENDSCDLKDME